MAKKQKEVLVVKAKVKEVLNSHGVNVSSEFIDAFNERLHELLEQVVERTTSNKRKTVMAHDL